MRAAVPFKRHALSVYCLLAMVAVLPLRSLANSGGDITIHTLEGQTLGDAVSAREQLDALRERIAQVYEIYLFSLSFLHHEALSDAHVLLYQMEIERDGINAGIVRMKQEVGRCNAGRKVLFRFTFPFLPSCLRCFSCRVSCNAVTDG